MFLAFGYVRDGKNLVWLSVSALAQVPEAFLVVAGSVASTKNKPFAYYRELAATTGCFGSLSFCRGLCGR